MKLCLFSDIHGNSYAFNEFLNCSSKLAIDCYIFCGDIFGYYYDQNTIISEMRNMKNLYCIKGNHDQNFLDIYSKTKDEKKLIDKYGNSYRNIVKKISDTNCMFIKNMSESMSISYLGKKIGVFHGSPIDPLNGRVYPNTKILENQEYNKYDYTILGHTHYRMVRNIDSSIIVNPGSIGQPRDSNGHSFATLTIPNGFLEFYKIHWERKKLLEDIERYDNNNLKLIDILFREE